MDTTKKYNLSPATEEERAAFMEELNILALKHSLYLEAVPQFERIEQTTSFQTKATLLIQKMTEQETDGSIPSPLSDEMRENG